MAHEQKPSKRHELLVAEAKALLRHLGWKDEDLDAPEHVMVVKEVVESLVAAHASGLREGLDKGHEQGWKDHKRDARGQV